MFWRSPSQSKHKKKCSFLLDVVVYQSSSIVELLTSKYQALLIRRNALSILQLLLDNCNGIAGVYVESDGIALKCANEDLHDCF